jgi:beta-barrel assembly-enhancing protease
MKNTKIALTVILVFVLLAVFFSCGSMGNITDIGATIAEQAGLLSPTQADILKKSGVAADSWSKAFEQITPEQEYYIGRAVGATVLSSYKLQTDKPDMVAYVNKICNALVINTDRPEIFNGYHVNILDSDEINAFATPGGHIFITRGLISCAETEDALASVIAHEIAHIQLQHGLKAIKNSRVTQALSDTASAGSTAAGFNLGQVTETFGISVNEIVTTMMKNGYSQTQEFEADSTGMAFLSLAGYEPSALLDMLGVLEKTQGSHPGGFNKTHPTPAQRITNAKKTAGNYNVPDTRSYRAQRFLAVRL